MSKETCRGLIVLSVLFGPMTFGLWVMGKLSESFLGCFFGGWLGMAFLVLMVALSMAILNALAKAWKSATI